MFFYITRHERASQFPYVFFEKNDPKVPSKIKVSSHYEEGKANVEFISKVQQCYQVFYQATLVRFSTRHRFQQKDCIETLQVMEMLLLKALREGNFGHELQQMSSFFSSHLNKFKLETQLKTLRILLMKNKLE